MSLKKDYILNTGILGGAKVLENIFGYIIIVLLTRSFGAEGLGIYSFVFSFVGFFFIFSDLGLSTLMQKDVSKNSKLLSRYANSITSIKLVSTIICFLILTVVAYFARADLFFEILIVGVLYFANSLNASPHTTLLLLKKGGILSSLILIERVIAVLGIATVIYFFNNIAGIFIILLLSSVIKVILNWIISLKYYTFAFSFDLEYAKELLTNSYPFMLIGLFTTIYVQIDTIFLAYLYDDVIVGFYNAPYRLINMLFFIPALAMTFGFPLLSELERKNKAAMEKLFKHIVFYSMSFLFPIIIGIWVFSSRILEFIYGFSDIESVTAFYILSVAMIFIFITTYLGHLLSAHNMQKKFLVVSLIGAIINIVLNIILIPPFSLYGAGVATIITYVCMFLMLNYLVRKNILKNYFDWKLVLSLIGCAVMILVAPFVVQFHLFIGVVVLGSLYAVIVWPLSVWIDFKGDVRSYLKKFLS